MIDLFGVRKFKNPFSPLRLGFNFSSPEQRGARLKKLLLSTEPSGNDLFKIKIKADDRNNQ